MKKNKYKAKDFSYYLFQLLRYPAKWFMHNRLNFNIIKNEAKDDKGPFFITGNHVTAYDPIISLVYLRPLIKWVAADANLDNKLKKFLFKIARVIPITKRYSDVRTIKRLISEVKAGNAVGLFPEGGRTWSGETDPLIRSTAKLIKLLGIKVYCQKLEGAYVSSPRWGRTLRKGRLDITIYQMLSEEDVKKMTDEEIFEALEKHLYHNDFDYQRKEMVKLAGIDRAEYIERLIYVCPICQHIHTFKSLGDYFECRQCHAKGKVNEYGFLEGDFPYDNLVDWDHYQKDFLKNYLQGNEVNPIEIYEVSHKSLSEEGNKVKNLVNWFVYKDHMIIDTEENRQIIPYEEISEASITFKNTIIFYENKNRHELEIEPFLHHHVSICYVKEIINHLREEKNGC